MFVWRLCWVVNLPIDLSISPSLSMLSLSLPLFSSPIGGLQIRYDSSGSLPGPGLGLLGAGGGGGETVPPVATSIEQLLERQWNEGQSFLLQQGAQGDGERTHTLCWFNLQLSVPLSAQKKIFQPHKLWEIFILFSKLNHIWFKVKFNSPPHTQLHFDLFS